MSRISEQSREAGTRVEAGEATPVDRSRPTHERRRLKIPDEGVVLDPPRVRQAPPPFPGARGRLSWPDPSQALGSPRTALSAEHCRAAGPCRESTPRVQSDRCLPSSPSAGLGRRDPEPRTAGKHRLCGRAPPRRTEGRARRARARVRAECRLVGRAPRRGPQLLSADARGHRGCDVVRPHQPVRVPARRRGRPVRGGPDREGTGRCARARDRRPAGIRPRARLAGVLRAADGGRDSGVRGPCGPAAGATRAAERGRGHAVGT